MSYFSSTSFPTFMWSMRLIYRIFRKPESSIVTRRFVGLYFIFLWIFVCTQYVSSLDILALFYLAVDPLGLFFLLEVYLSAYLTVCLSANNNWFVQYFFYSTGTNDSLVVLELQKFKWNRSLWIMCLLIKIRQIKIFNFLEVESCIKIKHAADRSWFRH